MESKETLPEKEFIDEAKPRDPRIMWFWLFFIAALTALFWGVGSYYSGFVRERVQKSPFSQVTNRAMSVFLWQHPQMMRAHVRRKSGYLPAFEYMGTVAVDPESAELYVSAPPELLFRYHTWNRLHGELYFPRPIPMREFAEFLEYDAQWRPQFWKEAPEDYKQLIKGLDPLSSEDLERRSYSALPLIVRQAFSGWRNYAYEAEDLNALQPTVEGMQDFLTRYPEYKRSLWQNIVDDQRVQYLLMLEEQHLPLSEKIPSNQLSPFLRASYYNDAQSLLHK